MLKAKQTKSDKARKFVQPKLTHFGQLENITMSSGDAGGSSFLLNNQFGKGS